MHGSGLMNACMMTDGGLIDDWLMADRCLNDV
jgi:hypothetical protein